MPIRSFLLFFLMLALPGAAVAKLPAPLQADRVLIEKSARRMTLFQGEKTLKVYRVALGREPVGPKRQQGDGKTPEGLYTIDARNPQSSYHLSLRISYPNAADQAQAAERGVKPGGQIMIHGLPNGVSDFEAWHRLSDWTDGCIAVTDTEIQEIWKLVRNGTPVEILP